MHSSRAVVGEIPSSRVSPSIRASSQGRGCQMRWII
jgi:hypothetical protein